ncbi:MAG: AMP-binding protein [Rhodospirillaceae bacterium]|nr:AMP-binding protein [Rhodospirillaceae bacterium]
MPTPPVFRIDPSAPRFETVIHALDRHAETQGGREGLIVEDRSLTYRQYRAAVAGLAERLIALGASGRRVAVVMPNGLETAVALLGAMAAGAQVAPINPGFTDPEILRALKDAEPQIILCRTDFRDRAAALAPQAGAAHVIALGEGGERIEPWAADETRRLPPLPKGDDLAIMFFTGGTTGVPKAAQHKHSGLMAHARAALGVWPLEQDRERCLNVAPAFHIWGFWFTALVPMHAGATTIIVPVYKPAAVLEAFAKQRATVFAGGPSAIYVGLRGNENYRSTDFSSLKFCLSGGAPCSEELLTAWERETGTAIFEGIGMSEAAPIAGNPVKGRRKVRSVGVPVADTVIEIVDLDSGTRVLPTGEAGEIRLKGPQVMVGYRNRPEETANAIRDGWLYTGDIGQFDEDGYLFVVDRKKEMILVGGFNVYPREIDELLVKHPAIHEAAAVGVPDPFSGEAVKIYVALKPGATLTREALEAYCEANLVKYKRPKHIEFLAALPKTSVGKLDKLALKRR